MGWTAWGDTYPCPFCAPCFRVFLFFFQERLRFFSFLLVVDVVMSYHSSCQMLYFTYPFAYMALPGGSTAQHSR